MTKSSSPSKAGTLNRFGQEYGKQIPVDNISDLQWAIMIKRFRQSGKSVWNEQAYGAYPMTPACHAPIELQNASTKVLEEMVKKLKESSGGSYL